MSGAHPSQPPVEPPVERRRRRRGTIDRLLTAPVSSSSLAAPIGGARRVAARTVRIVAVPAALIALAYLGFARWSARVPELSPRHRAEALCFALAQPPRFVPPMIVEASSAMVRGRFSERTPTALALRETMRFTEEMVIQERTVPVGDYEVSHLWLRLPSGRGGHWLVVAWKEGADLAISSFHFESPDPDLGPDEIAWGTRLLEHVLVPENFQAASLPAVRLRVSPDSTLLTFGPPESAAK